MLILQLPLFFFSLEDLYGNDFLQKDVDPGEEKSKLELNGEAGKDLIAHRLEEIYKRLEFIDAYTAEARAASILAVSSSSITMSRIIDRLNSYCLLKLVHVSILRS